MNTMASNHIHIRIVVETWVEPYLRLMDRMGLGERAADAVREFVKANGMRPIT